MPEYEDVLYSEAKVRANRKQRDSHTLAHETVAPELRGWKGGKHEGLSSPRTVLSMQRMAGNAAVVQLLSEGETDVEQDGGGASPVLDVVGQGGGKPLDTDTRKSMEKHLGADLGDVRVHDDAAATASAKSVDAHAYTVGNDVVFQSGNYRPDTAEGKKTLAHELTHVIQQRNGPVAGTDTGNGVAVSHPDDPFERAASANADRVASADGHVGASSSKGVQREANLEDGADPLAVTAQREEEEGEEDVEETG